MIWTLAIIVGYALGSLPTGVLLGHLSGADPRQSGSGNIGASNVTRTMGWRFGVIVLLVDVGKGALAATLPLWIGGDTEHLAAAGAAAVLGHCYPVWLKFKGGKGVATAMGAMLVGAPVVAIITALVWAATVFITRIPALGSLIGVVLFALLTRHKSVEFPVHLMAIGIGAVIVLRHRSNIRLLVERLKNPQAGRRRRTPPQSQVRNTSAKRGKGHKTSKSRRKR